MNLTRVETANQKKSIGSVLRLRQQGRICIVLQGDPGRLPAQLLKSQTFDSAKHHCCPSLQCVCV